MSAKRRPSGDSTAFTGTAPRGSRTGSVRDEAAVEADDDELSAARVREPRRPERERPARPRRAHDVDAAAGVAMRSVRSERYANAGRSAANVTVE